VILVISVLTLASDAQPVLDEAYRQNPQLSDQGFTQHDLLVMLYVVIGLVLAGAVAAATFAVLLYRGRRWAYYALLGAAALSSLFFLVSTLGSLIGLLPLAASVGTIICLVRPEVRAWVVRR
jgi:O-antigen ligase